MRYRASVLVAVVVAVAPAARADEPSTRFSVQAGWWSVDAELQAGGASRAQTLPVDVEGEERWLSIPPDTWHQGVVGDEDWVVVSFHTVPKTELVEERPDPEDPDPFHPRRTRRRRYADVIQP